MLRSSNFQGPLRRPPGWNTAGVNWFITGKSSNIPVTNKNKGFPGFFSEVFQQTDEVAMIQIVFPHASISQCFVTEALLNKRVLAFSVVDIAGAGTGSHAMTLWGVKYDENGVISEAYYCDNNNSDQDRTGQSSPAIRSFMMIRRPTFKTAPRRMEEHTENLRSSV